MSTARSASGGRHGSADRRRATRRTSHSLITVPRPIAAEAAKGALDNATFDAQIGATRKTTLQVIAGGITSKVPGLGDAADKFLVDSAFEDFQDIHRANDQLKDEFEQLALLTIPGNSDNELDVNHDNRSEFNQARQNGQS